MANILTATEAANILRCAETDPAMLDLLPQVDAYIQNATGRDWTSDDPVRPEAKSAARMLIVRWHEDPGGMAAVQALGFGLTAALVQLEALALTLEAGDVPGEGLALVASVPPAGYSGFSAGASPILIFNHEMAAGAVDQVSLATAAGVAVATTNNLDPTGKILTVRPDAPLAAATSYVLDIDQAADVHGLTIETELRFST
jgi:hypothetical protein